MQVGFETEGTAIFDTMSYIGNEVRLQQHGTAWTPASHAPCTASHVRNTPPAGLAYADQHSGSGRRDWAVLHAAVGGDQGPPLHAAACHR